MEVQIIQSFAQYWPAVFIMAIMIYWFTRQIDKKDSQNQGNLDKFIAISEKYSSLTERVALSLDAHIEKIDWHWRKLDLIHDDIKVIKERKCKAKLETASE